MIENDPLFQSKLLGWLILAGPCQGQPQLQRWLKRTLVSSMKGLRVEGLIPHVDCKVKMVPLLCVLSLGSFGHHQGASVRGMAKIGCSILCIKITSYDVDILMKLSYQTLNGSFRNSSFL